MNNIVELNGSTLVSGSMKAASAHGKDTTNEENTIKTFMQSHLNVANNEIHE